MDERSEGKQCRASKWVPDESVQVNARASSPVHIYILNLGFSEPRCVLTLCGNFQRPNKNPLFPDGVVDATLKNQIASVISSHGRRKKGRK